MVRMEMDEQLMTWSFTPSLIPLVLVSVPAGAMLGLAYFAALRRTVDSLVTNPSLWVIAGLFLARLAILCIIALYAIRFGAVPLLALTGGLLATRSWMVRQARKEAAG